MARIKGNTGVMGGSSRHADKFVIRLPEGLRERIKEVAATQHRSMNAFVIHTMEAALKVEELAAGTYVEPEVGEESSPEQVYVSLNFCAGTACRYEGRPVIIRSMVVSGDWIEADISNTEDPLFVPLEVLEAY